MNWWTATTRGRCAGGKAGPGAGTSTWWTAPGPGRPGSRGCCSPTTPRRWINASTRWPPRCAPPIRAPARSAAPTRWAPWAAAPTGSHAGAGPPSARPPLRVGPSGAVVVHVIAEADSLTEDTPAVLDGAAEPDDEEAATPLREQTIAEALAPPAPTGTATTNPAVIVGGGLLPAPLLAAKLAGLATLRPLIHPGDAAPEPRYTPSRGLADFVRCRDMTCRFPGCDEPAYACDLDHTIAYPVGPTCASNLTCLCRKHHLLKTFWGWLERQRPDGTVEWTAPNGQTYTTHPGSRLLFPTLCTPTAPIDAPATAAGVESNRGLKMPRRKATRAQDRAKRIEAERRLNDDYVAERNKPPPF